MSIPTVSTIIVSWNTKELLRTCINRLQNQVGVNLTICVVDNNSADGTQEMLREEFPHIKKIYNTKNKGFAAANNQFFSLTTTDFTVLVNADTEVTGVDTLKQIGDAHHRTNAGIIGPRLLNPDGTIQHSVRAFPRVWSQICFLLKLHLLFPKFPSVVAYTLPDFVYEKEQQVDQVSGAFFSVSQKCKEAVGNLDEHFWIWFEEVDYCKRATNKGFTVWYSPMASIIHHGAQSFSQLLPLNRQRLFNKSLRMYAKKHFSFLGWVLISLTSFIGVMLAWITPTNIKPSSYRKKI